MLRSPSLAAAKPGFGSMPKLPNPGPARQILGAVWQLPSLAAAALGFGSCQTRVWQLNYGLAAELRFGSCQTLVGSYQTRVWQLPNSDSCPGVIGVRSVPPRPAKNA